MDDKIHINDIRYLSNYISDDLIYFKETNYDFREKSPLHSHDFYEIYIVLNGRINHFINGTEIVLEKGSLQFINPLDVHYLEGGSTSKNEIINFAFSANVYNELMSKMYIVELQINPAIRLEPFQFDTVITYMKLLKREKIQKEQFVLFLLLNYYYLTRGIHISQTKSIVPNWLKKTLNLMESHSNLVLGVKRFVELSNKSQEHVSRIMKETCGMTVSEWINTQKLERARSLVHKSSMSILDISLEVGYESESYFYRLYKEKYGETPYQDRLKEDKTF